MISKLSILGYIAAGIYLFMDIWHYYITYPDISEFITGLALAFCIAGCSFLYNKTLQQGYTITALEEALQDKLNERRL